MYRMNTRLRTIPLLTSATNSSTKIVTQSANDRISLPTFVSRGLQTGLETVTVDSPNGGQTQYFEKGTTQVKRREKKIINNFRLFRKFQFQHCRMSKKMKMNFIISTRHRF